MKIRYIVFMLFVTACSSGTSEKKQPVSAGIPDSFIIPIEKMEKDYKDLQDSIAAHPFRQGNHSEDDDLPIIIERPVFGQPTESK
jgi:hypothetical protein